MPIAVGAAALRVVGFRGMHLLSYPIAFAIFLFHTRSRKNALRFWRRLRPDSDLCTQYARIWRHFACFGRLLCDRLLVYHRAEEMRLIAPHRFRLRESYVPVGSQPHIGRIILSAHIGNWALAGRILSRWGGPTINVVKVDLETPAERAVYDGAMGDRAPNVIDPRDPLGATLAIREALLRGETVGMLGDRVFGGQSSVAVSFLGRTARFPTGPFQIAAATGAPIFVCFCLRHGDAAYQFVVDEAWQIRLPANRAQRGEVVREAVQRWASRLEQEVRRRPLQWHNFHDVWA